MPVVIGHLELLEFAASWILVFWESRSFRDSQHGQ